MSINQASHLRERARHLRRLATTIETTPAMQLEQLAGDDTWRGRRPHLCRNLLQRNLARLHASAEDLRWHAYLLEQRAVAAEALSP